MYLPPFECDAYYNDSKHFSSAYYVQGITITLFYTYNLSGNLAPKYILKSKNIGSFVHFIPMWEMNKFLPLGAWSIILFSLSLQYLYLAHGGATQ